MALESLGSAIMSRLVEDDIPPDRKDLNRWLDVFLGIRGAGLALRGHEGERYDNALTTNFNVDAQSTIGNHAAFLLSATAEDAQPTTANAVVRIVDAALQVGAGKAMQLYATAGTNYAPLTSDTNGRLMLGTGTGSASGSMTAAVDIGAGGDVQAGGNLSFLSGTANILTLDHALTGSKTQTFQDLSGAVALLGVANVAGHLLFTDNTYDIGASGATRPRTLYLGTDLFVGQDATVVRNLIQTGTSAASFQSVMSGTAANRHRFMTSTVNGTSNFGIAPNGTGTAAAMRVYEGSALNTSGHVGLFISSSVAALFTGNDSGTVPSLEIRNVASVRMTFDATGFSFNGETPIARPEITSARDDPEGALADLLDALDQLGLITDSSTAS